MGPQSIPKQSLSIALAIAAILVITAGSGALLYHWRASLNNKPWMDLSIVHPQLPSFSNVRVVSKRGFSSDDPLYPFGMELTIETDRAIEPVAFVVACDGDIGVGQAVLRSNGVYLLYRRTKQGVPAGHPNWFAFEWESPAFTTDSPIVVTIFSKNTIHTAHLQQVPYEWP